MSKMTPHPITLATGKRSALLSHLLKCAILCLWRVSILTPLLNVGDAPAQPVAMRIENEHLQVQYISPGGYLSIRSKAVQQPFVSFATLAGDVGTATVTNRSDPIFGNGQSLEVVYPNGNRDRIILFQHLPFALLQHVIQNSGKEPIKVDSVATLSARLDLGKAGTQLKTFGTGGLLAPDKNPGSYAWLAAVEPQSRNGVVFGWLTHDRASGVLFSKLVGDDLVIDAAAQYGKLLVPPGQTAELETLCVGYFDDARLGLEAWADAVARQYQIRLRPQATGYCTWYSRPYGGASDEQHLAQLAEFSANNLAPFGFSVVQIDDGWQSGFKRKSPSSPKKDFRTHNPSGPYPHGMKPAAEKIKSLGLVPGIWLMPFAGTLGDPFFDEHLDWFAKTADGKPYDTPWGGACLDLSHPGARDYVRSVVERICRDWGYQYIKIDGLWTGTATRQLYVNSGYKPDDLGQARFSNPEKTAIENFRSGLKLVREAAGENVYILGCCAPQNMRSYAGAFGLVDAMRVGPDNGAEWKSLLRGPTFGTRNYFLHQRIWYNDPDPVYVRESVPLNHARLVCSWVALSGQMNLNSEWMPGLSPERLDILKRTMPSHNAIARPVDLFERDLPRVWTVTAPDRTVVGLFNWDSADQTFEIDLAKLGLEERTPYTAYDFWSDMFDPIVKDRLHKAVAGESCAVLLLRKKADHPTVVSTSRHVTQGIIDLESEAWDAKTKVLSGRSQVVAKDLYELRVAGPVRLRSVEVAREDNSAAVTTAFVNEGPITRIRINSPVSQKVSWKLNFE